MAAEQLLLINPRRRKRRAKRRHVARRRRRARTVVAAPRRRRRRVARRNPVFRARRRRHVARVHRRRVRRNPFRIGGGGVMRMVMPAAVGALGAVGLDVAYGYVGGMLPPAITSNPWLTAAVKIAGAFGLGWVASKAIGREQGKLVTAGAVTVIVYGLSKNLIHQAAPQLPGLAGFGAYMEPGFGAYNPAPYLTDGSPPRTMPMGAYMPQIGMSGLEGVSSEGSGMF